MNSLRAYHVSRESDRVTNGEYVHASSPLHHMPLIVDLAIEPGVHALGYIMPCTCTFTRDVKRAFAFTRLEWTARVSARHSHCGSSTRHREGPGETHECSGLLLKA
jgi:hypothetical protein